MSFFLLLNTKEDILKNVCKELTVAIDFHSTDKKINVCRLFGYTHSSKAKKEKKETHKHLEQVMRK